MTAWQEDNPVRNPSLLVLLASASLCAGAPAFAQAASQVVYAKVAPGYLLKDVGVEASDLPVVQGGYTYARGPWSFGPWASVGKRRYAKELDLTGFYDTSMGPVKFQASRSGTS